MQISVSSTLTVYHDGQFWVGLAEHVEDGRYGAARIVFGAEPSDEEILRFVVIKWAKLSFFGHDSTEASKPAKNPKRRAREAAKALKQPAMSTKAQQALAEQREALKRESAHARSRRRADEAEAQRCQFHLKPTPLSIAPLVNNQSPSRSEGPPFLIRFSVLLFRSSWCARSRAPQRAARQRRESSRPSPPGTYCVPRAPPSLLSR